MGDGIEPSLKRPYLSAPSILIFKNFSVYSM